MTSLSQKLLNDFLTVSMRTSFMYSSAANNRSCRHTRSLTRANGKVTHAGEFAKRAIKKCVEFLPGAPFYGINPDLSTLRLSFAAADVGKIEEGLGGCGKRPDLRDKHARILL